MNQDYNEVDEARLLWAQSKRAASVGNYESALRLVAKAYPVLDANECEERFEAHDDWSHWYQKLSLPNPDQVSFESEVHPRWTEDQSSVQTIAHVQRKDRDVSKTPQINDNKIRYLRRLLARIRLRRS